MNITCLAIDSNVERMNAEAVSWAKREIFTERVDSMTDGIDKLMNADYLFVGINSDVVEYKPLLKTMRTVTDIPIFIATSNFESQDEFDAIENGADLFTRWYNSIEENITAVLTHIARKTERMSIQQKILFYGGILISLSAEKVFINEIKIDLTQQEYDLLLFFMLNREIVHKYEEIYREVWNAEYDGSAIIAIKSTVKRLRKKISVNSDETLLIKNIHGVGFALSTINEQ